MRIKVLLSAVTIFAIMAVSGCVSMEDYNRLQAENESNLARLQDMEGAQERLVVENDSLRRQLSDKEIQLRACNERVSVLQSARDGLMGELGQLAQQVGQAPLPPELSSALQDWAAQSAELVTYNQETGMVRFKSDLLFDPGQATVAENAVGQLRSLATILNTPAARNFDALIVGHTDNMPIRQPETLRRHPTNWHLSAHRAIEVQKIIAESGVAQERTAVVGMGEFRPIAENAPNRGGNPLNRRVEIYIVPSRSLTIGRAGQ